MGDSEVSGRMRNEMRDDWNARAREDAGFYVACGRREQNDADFFATATEVINGLEIELQPRAGAPAQLLESARDWLWSRTPDAPHEPPFRGDPWRRRFR